MPAQAQSPLRVRGERDSGPPSGPVIEKAVDSDGLDHDRPPHSPEPPQLLRHDLGLQLQLGRPGGMLPIASAAAAGAGVGARARYPVRGGGEHLDGIRAQEAVARTPAGDNGDHSLTGQRVTNEDDLPLVAGDTVPAVRDRSDVE
jgi:hypothetical protein